MALTFEWDRKKAASNLGSKATGDRTSSEGLNRALPESVVGRSAVGIFWFQSHEAITIPTSESMNIAAPVSAGDFYNRIMIGE